MASAKVAIGGSGAGAEPSARAWESLRRAASRVAQSVVSCPSTTGVLYFRRSLNSPSRTILSSGLMLAALTRTRTSQGPTVGSGTWAARRPLLPYYSTTNAFKTDRLWRDDFWALGCDRCYAAVMPSSAL